MLKVEREISYLSPSSLGQALNMPNTFYLRRLVKDPMDKEAQSKAASAGSAFDYFIKKKMINFMFENKSDKISELLNGIENNKEWALEHGYTIANTYIDWGLLKEEHWADVEVDGVFDYCGIPIMVKLDMTVYHKIDEVQSIPLDLKLTGYINGASPPPGYCAIFKKGRKEGPHKKYREDIKIEEINTSFARQLCTYGWKLGWSPNGEFEDFPVKLHIVAFTKKKNMSVAIYKAWVTRELQIKTLSEYDEIWMSIKSGDFIERLISQNDKNLVFLQTRKENWW